MRWWLAVLILVVPAAAGNYDDAIKAHKAGDKATLRKLAEGDNAWKLALSLCAHGKGEAAAALAQASDHYDVAKLPGHVARWRKQPVARAEVDWLKSIDRTHGRKAWAALLALTGKPATDPFVDAYRIVEQGIALAHLRDASCPGVLEEAARRCETIGWYFGQWLAIHNLAWFHGVNHRPKEALASFLRELKLRERRGVPITAVAANLGAAYGLIGDYRHALIYFKRAAAGQRGNTRARTLNNSALALSFLGEYAKAYGYYEEALRIGSETQAIESLTGLSNVEARLGNTDKAEKLALGALQRARDMGNDALVVQCEGNLGNVYEEREDWNRALEVYGRAETDARKLKHAWYERIASANIAVVHFKSGDAAKARELLAAVIPRLEEIGHASMAMRCTVRLGEAEAKLGNHDAALAHFRKTAEAAREQEAGANEVLALEAMAHVQLDRDNAEGAVATARAAGDALWQLVRGLSDEQGAGAREKHVGLFAIGIRAAVRQGDPATLAEFIERGRAGSLLESLQAREDIRSALLPDSLQKEEDDATTDLALARRKYLEARRSRNRKSIRTAKKELESARARVGEIQQRIQRALKAGASLVYPTPLSLAQIQSHLRPGETLVEFAMLEDNTVALVATRDDARMVRLGSSRKIEEADTEALRDLVVKPLALGKAKRVLISPDGALYRVPFVRLLGMREVAYVPSGTTYALLRPAAAVQGKGILALGAVDYSGRKLVALPETRAEAKEIGTDVLLADRATEAEFWKLVPSRKRWHAIHFACHGLIDIKAPMQSALAVTARKPDDGLLTGFEILRRRLPADLVVLSACETGRGKFYRGEGLLGLTRAFLFAGSPRVILSLWNVDDDATRALMVKFYELWKKHPAARALRLAQAHVAKQPKWRDPRFWAAWQLWGIGA